MLYPSNFPSVTDALYEACGTRLLVTSVSKLNRPKISPLSTLILVNSIYPLFTMSVFRIIFFFLILLAMCIRDSPGTYSLSAYTPEEIYVRRHIIDETPDVIINVVDSSNLERNLYLTTQLIDMNVRMVVALNIYDELESSGNTLDYHLLSKLFGVPMLPTVSKKNRGLDTLFHVVINLYEGVDFFDKQGNMNPEVLKDLTEWHDSLEDRKNHEEEHLEDYVREHKRTGRVSVSYTHLSLMRHHATP